MKLLLTALPAALLLAACSKAPEATAPVAAAPAASAATKDAHTSAIAWVKPEGSNVDAIFAKAKADNKPVFLYWGAVWCPPCNQIKATVFNRPDFIERSKAFVPVYLDGDTKGAQKLGTQFKVRGYPTMILFKPDGTELTRLPGEVDASQYMQVLAMGLATTYSVKESLAAVLEGGADAAKAKAAMTPDAWRMLAFYSWDTDEAKLLPKKDLAATLQKLAQACPADNKGASARLALKAITAAAKDNLPGFDKAAALARAQQVLADPALARDNFDVLTSYAGDIVPAITTAGSPERAKLLADWNAALDKLSTDASLSKADRLGAIQGKVSLAESLRPKDSKAPLDAALVAQAREAANLAVQTTTDKYERQAVVPNAADLLADAGLLDESDALLKAELPKAVSPYYHMLVLASNAKKRGDKAGSLNWAEKAYTDSEGPATRMQWGTGYVTKIVDLTPQDSARIEKAAAQVISELEPSPETFYERNRRSLEKMGAKLMAWNAGGSHSAVVKKLSAQLDGVCAKLPAQDDAREACAGVFKPQAAAKKAKA
jgi:thiol-disulfide isomerase/thioredoxin